VADFTFDGKETTIPTKIKFENTSRKSKAFEWKINDQLIAKTENVDYLFKESGRYTIVLTAQKGNKKSAVSKELIMKAPEECLVLLSTSEGDILIKLYNNTLLHQDNLIKLLEENFYRDILFHRVIEGFMIQAGDPQSKNAAPGQRSGAGDLTYTLPNEINKENFHFKGALAAARVGDQANPEKRSSASQFYIVHGEPVTESQLNNIELKFGFKYPEKVRKKYLAHGGAPQLDMNYTVYGEVIKGLEVVDKIATSKTDNGNRPTTNISILEFIVLK
jgi:peptidyl-prolyl cis-trans isomerase B (cyclophilin B)